MQHESTGKRLALGTPATCRIQVQGYLDDNWSDRLWGMQIMESIQDGQVPVTTLVGLGLDLAFTPKWILRQRVDFFYLEISDYQGAIFNYNLGLEWLFSKHVGLGISVDARRIQVEAEGETDVPGVDFIGDIRFANIGGQLYLKLFF